MVRIYFVANAVINGLIGVACMLNPERLARAVGYFTLDNSGSSDFLVVYAGLELALAAFYVVLALDETHEGIGLTFSVLLYGGLVAFRIPSLLIYNPVRTITLVTAALETVLLLVGVALWTRARHRAARGEGVEP